MMEDVADALREDISQQLADLLGVAMHQVDEERVEARQVAHELHRGPG